MKLNKNVAIIRKVGLSRNCKAHLLNVTTRIQRILLPGKGKIYFIARLQIFYFL